MPFSYKQTIKLAFKELPSDFVQEFIAKIKHVHIKPSKTIAIQADISLLSQQEKKVLLDDGQFPPSYIHYWTNIVFTLNKYYSGLWISVPDKKYYDDTIGTTIDLMSDSMRWENNIPNTFFVWGDIDQSRIFKKPMNCKGIIMPAMEGWAIIALLDDEDSLILKEFLPGF